MRRTLLALALLALIGTGCSGGPAASGSTGDDRAPDRDQAVRFAGCMRDNGVKDFPDPDASGELTADGIANGTSLDTASAAFRQAMAACKDLQPAGFTGHARSAAEQEGALRFARCVRDNGVKDFPDPTPDSPLIDTNRIPSSAGEDGMSRLNTATRACRDLAAAAGVTGP
jgi:hypothetical protein